MGPPLALLLGAASLAASCSPSTTLAPALKTTTAATPLAAAVTSVQQTTLAAEDDCSTLTPPIGFEPKTAFEPLSTPNAVEVAKRRALTELKDRYATLTCPYVAEGVKEWTAKQTSTQVCVMAVVDKQLIQRCKQEMAESAGKISARAVREELQKHTTALLGAPAKNQKVVVLIDKIEDQGTPGGQRAVWLKTLVGEAVSGLGYRVAEPPQKWDGRGIPSGMTAVVLAKVFGVMEEGKPAVQVVWTVRQGGGEQSRSMLIPEGVIPEKAPDPTPSIPKDPSLFLRLTAADAGSLCPGQKTKLYATSTQKRHVQVYELYGKNLDQAILIYPAALQLGELEANQLTDLVGEMVAVPVPGSEAEQFLALGVDRRELLGAFAEYQAPCRLSPDDVEALKGTWPKKVVRSGEGYRIFKEKRCEGIPVPDLGNLQADLAKLPICGETQQRK